MERKVYMTFEDFKRQNSELGTNLPFADSTAVLKNSLTIQGKEIKNRLVCQAMEGCDSTPDGRPDELTKRRYNRLAKGGAGLIWYEATAVMQEGRANPRQLYINEKTLDSFKAQLEDIKETGLRENGFEPVVIMQVTHSGRYSKPEGKP
ncbi:MAG: flavin oxidoreductase/NADH oxidase, partial [Oscillospiraceae bacterium]|nr:flavin oxidoreductase/NADH oxidase [Oscillospiraceae bacterium]